MNLTQKFRSPITSRFNSCGNHLPTEAALTLPSLITDQQSLPPQSTEFSPACSNILRLLHHDLQNTELSWPLGGLICRPCSEVYMWETNLGWVFFFQNNKTNQEWDHHNFTFLFCFNLADLSVFFLYSAKFCIVWWQSWTLSFKTINYGLVAKEVVFVN